jgi:hypothetical protein
MDTGGPRTFKIIITHPVEKKGKEGRGKVVLPLKTAGRPGVQKKLKKSLTIR